MSGAQFMLAYATGFEAGVRSAVPRRAITRAAGTHRHAWQHRGRRSGGKLLDLDAQKLTYAMGIAATQAGGMQQNRGTMCKSLHAGKAAANGVLAALLAERGFEPTQEIIEGKKGFSRIYSDIAEPEHLTESLGKGWLIESNGHKPYACGVVLHPLIDAVDRDPQPRRDRPRRGQRNRAAGQSAGSAITGVVEPSTGLQSKFSTLHSAAVALIDGMAGTAQYSDARATDPAVAALRDKVKADCRRYASQGRSPCRHRRRRPASRSAYRACQRHRGKSHERRADRGEVPGQCHAGDRRRARGACCRVGRRVREQAGRARIDRAAGLADHGFALPNRSHERPQRLQPRVAQDCGALDHISRRCDELESAADFCVRRHRVGDAFGIGSLDDLLAVKAQHLRHRERAVAIDKA